MAAQAGAAATGMRAEAELQGVPLVFHALGALYLPDCRALVVSDLHLEKGAAFARRGQLLPPWDTHATLNLLETVIAAFDPAIILSLGDNFHDRAGSVELPQPFRDRIRAMASGREMIWIAGNHDPDGVHDLPGIELDEVFLGGLTFRHIPQKGAADGEVSGHLHPSATLVRQDRAVRRPCFAMDARRLVMPSFGVMTGGLDLRHEAFRGLFERASLTAHMLGRERLYSVPFARLRG